MVYQSCSISDNEPTSGLQFQNICMEVKITLLVTSKLKNQNTYKCSIYIKCNQYKFTVVYWESVNLIGSITVCYLLIVNSYASVHMVRNI